jgi:sulfotransferase
MDQGIHFISGLPRSGSTLLSAILRQNPRFHAMMTSPVGAIYLSMLEATSRKNEASVFIAEDQRRALLKGVFENYYHAIGRRQVVFDTNRIWCSKMPALTQLFADAKLVCCVRHIPWIMDSVERLVRRNAFTLSGMFGYESGGTVYTRVNRLAVSDGMVGYALDCLRDSSTTSTMWSTAPTNSTLRSARRVCIPCARRSSSSSGPPSCRPNCSPGSRTTPFG